METWDELDNEEDSKKDEEKANLALMTLTYFEADFDSESKEEDEVFSKSSYFDLITFVQDHMGKCQDKQDIAKINLR